jgi:hypothetical protein
MSETTSAFDSEAGYRATIAVTLARAQREIRIFDRDLTDMDLGTRANVALLESFFATGLDRRLRVVLHDTTAIETKLPRLLALMTQHVAQIEVRRTPDHLRHLADCWLLADRRDGIIRFNADQARGKCIAESPPEVEPWWRRFDDHWLECEPCSPWAVTGL